MLRRGIRLVHRWLGLLLALPLLMQGLSGAVLTLEPVWPEFGSAFGPGLAVATAPVSANAILAAARAAAPPGFRAARYRPGAEGAAATVMFSPEGNPRGPAMVLRLDPATATPLGDVAPVSGVLDWVRRLHNTMLLPQYGGRQLWGWVGAGLLLLTVLGLPLWWPRPGQWAAAVTVPRKARGARLHRALHGALGAWMSALLLATSITGIAQGFPQTLRQVLGLPAGGPPRPERAAPGARPPLPDLDHAIRLARQAMPGMEARLVLLPAAAAPIRLVMAPPGQDGAVAARTVTVDATGARLLSAQASPAANEAVLRWMHDVHEGSGLGPVWRGLVVLTGMALPAFGVTGVALWLLKRRNRRQMRAAQMTAMR
ncbi:MAG: PepSY-associated TM helix domain-containing protein [Janthinobacterium lividum]